MNTSVETIVFGRSTNIFILKWPLGERHSETGLLMRLLRMNIDNFRSIKNSGGLRVELLQGFVGENNAGKSNILRAIECFLTTGAGGMKPDDFNDPSEKAIIEAEFGDLSKDERRRLRTYLIGDRLILQKQLTIAQPAKSGKTKVVGEYHGYRAEPQDWWLSTTKVMEKEGSRPNWKKIAEEHDILDYVRNAGGKVNKASYEAGLTKLLYEREDIEFDTPKLGHTHMLGLQPNLMALLPKFYLLPAITDYSDEISRRSSSTVFRRLMADLADRIMRADPRYGELETTLTKLRQLLNPAIEGEEPQRLDALSSVEISLRDTIRRLIPDVDGVQLAVEVDEPKEIFSKGVTIKVDDGVLTDVLSKGHGMQRSIVFALLQMLIKSGRQQEVVRPIILAIEEPELYIHPHAQRIIFRVLKDFAGLTDEAGEALCTDQVIYTTHSPAFVDISGYERIAVVRKEPVAGTIINQCCDDVLPTFEERERFKLLTSFGLKHNELFFARDCIIVEGPEDEIGIIATARKLGVIAELPDEIGLSIVVADGKGGIPKFQKVLNAFGLDYGVLLELDGKPETDRQTKPILDNLNGNRLAKIAKSLENTLGLDGHFDDQRHAKKFFSEPANINEEMETIVRSLLPESCTAGLALEA